jgi:PPM family protein phosphatase
MSTPGQGEPSPGAKRCDLRWSGLTHVGRVRTNNEDSFLALKVDSREVSYLGKTGESSLEGSDFIFAVSDGMGGARSGEFASKIAVDRITKLFPGKFRAASSGIAAGFSPALQELFAEIHSDLLKLGSSYAETAGMGATLSLCWFTPESMYFGHVGDSRIYHLPKDGSLVQVTHDHTHVGWLRRNTNLTEREARSHPRRNALNQALGAGNQIVGPQIGAIGHRVGDRFLICSDGLVDGLWDRQIEAIFKVGGTAANMSKAQELVEGSVHNSGRDNTTAVVIEIIAP